MQCYLLVCFGMEGEISGTASTHCHNWYLVGIWLLLVWGVLTLSCVVLMLCVSRWPSYLILLCKRGSCFTSRVTLHILIAFLHVQALVNKLASIGVYLVH